MKAIGLIIALAASTFTGAAPEPSANPLDATVELSLDGTSWQTELTTPLLVTPALWVPGETQTAHLFFRNRSDLLAAGFAEVRLGPADAELAAAIAVRYAYDQTPWREGPTGQAIRVRPGQVVRFDFELQFLPDAGNQTQARQLPVTVEVQLWHPPDIPKRSTTPPTPTVSSSGPPGQGGALAGPPSPQAGRRPGTGLPFTGADVITLALAGGVALVAGALLASVARRRLRRAP